MKNKLLIITFLFLSLTLTQQLAFNKIHQLQPRYNQTAYANQLAERQAKFDKMMKTIQQKADQLDKNISKLSGNDTYQIMKIQQGIADQRDALFNVQKFLNQPFALKPCQKPNLTQQQRDQLNQQIKATNQSLFDMKSQVKKCTEQSITKCTVSDTLINRITRAQIYLQVMDDWVNGKCNRVPRAIAPQTATGLVDLNDRLFKDNLKAPNWVYGNITQQKYRLMVFAETTKFNTTTCPIQTPFANKINNTCFNCPQGSIFSLGQRICTCQKGYKFDQQTNECVSLTPIRPCNQTGTCISMCPKDKPRWNSVNKICQACPTDKPIVNRKQNTCQPCPLQTPMWNQLTYRCQLCPKNTHYVPQVLKCVPCKDDQKYDQNLKKCVPICKSYQVYNKQQGKCYTLEELNGCKCNQKYNEQLKECQDVCDHGLQWLSAQKKCGPPSLPQFKDNCKYYQRLNKQTNQCQNYCDSTVAWYDRQNHVCIKIGCSVQCKCKQVFDNLTGKCIPQSHVCPSQQFYNTTSRQCQIYCTNGFVYNSQTKICQPPRETITPPPTPVIPTTCAFDELFDQVLHKCVKRCPYNFQFFNTVSRVCDCIQGYHMDYFAGGCVMNQVTCGLNQIFSKNQNKCVCIQDYHFENGICVKNPVTCMVNQVFDQGLNRCVCIQGYIVDSSNNCVPMCDYKLNKIYDNIKKVCVCSQGYILSQDGVTCVSIASTCLSVNHLHYDSLTNSCVCDTGYALNTHDGKCYEQRRKCNESLHFVLNLQTNQCQCKAGYRLSSDGQLCASLAEICLRNANTIFNPTSNKCQCLPGFSIQSQSGDIIVCQAICKIDQTFNSLTQKCVDKCPFDYNYDVKTQSCAYKCPADYKYNNSTLNCQKLIKTCPDPANQVYDQKTGQCHSCPAGYSLNRINLICQKRIMTCAPGQIYQPETGLCKYCKQGQTYNTVKKVCQYLNTTCTDGKYFNFTIGQCTSCPQNNVYDEYLLGCRLNCTQEQFFDYSKKVCALISSTCKDYEIYNSTQRKCVMKAACSSVQRYDETTNACIDKTFITSKLNKYLIHSNFSNYEKSYDQKKAADSNIQDCPEAHPFYSSSLKVCVLCPSTHPYYNLQTEKCLNCGNDKYDSTQRKCKPLVKPTQNNTKPGQLSYSLDRLVMNII